MSASITPLRTDDPSLANRYLADQLPEAERLAFEQRMAADPAVLREVEATARFKAGLARLRESGELAEVLEPQRSRLPYLASAAAVALLAIGISLVRHEAGGPEIWVGTSPTLASRDGSLLPAGGQYTLLRLRSEGEVDLAIELPATRQLIELRVLPDSGDAASRYRARLARLGEAGAERDAVAIGGVATDGNGYLTLFVDSDGLRPGRYQLLVEEEPAAGGPVRAETFLIAVQAAGTDP